MPRGFDPVCHIRSVCGDPPSLVLPGEKLRKKVVVVVTSKKNLHTRAPSGPVRAEDGSDDEGPPRAVAGDLLPCAKRGARQRHAVHAGALAVGCWLSALQCCNPPRIQGRATRVGCLRDAARATRATRAAEQSLAGANAMAGRDENPLQPWTQRSLSETGMPRALRVPDVVASHGTGPLPWLERPKCQMPTTNCHSLVSTAPPHPHPASSSPVGCPRGRLR